MEGEDKENNCQEQKQGTSIVKFKVNTMPERTVQMPPLIVAAAAEEEKKNHSCKECGKIFNSGKSLGGHISTAHVQSKKDYILKKVKSNPESDHKSLGKYCVLCGKEFTSSKALFGHMRCHPEREWRGMDPPPENGNVAAAAPDIATSLKGWSVTAKRGRPETSKPPPAAAPVVNDKNMISFFDKLMKFVEDHSEKDDDEIGDSGSNSLVENQFKKQKTEAAVTIDVADEKTMNPEAEAESKAEAAAESKAEVESQGTTIEENGDCGTSTQQNFICTTCNRSFRSHQALGGHRSSHNKFKLNIINTVNEGSNWNNNNVSRRQPGSYACKICDVSFSSGQALGRHNRSHREEEEKKEEESVGGNCEIDLNKLPNEKFDEDGGAQL